MKLILKKIEIERGKKELKEGINSNLKRLEDLKILQNNFASLNNADFLKLVANNYEIKLDEEDFKKIAEKTLKNHNIKKARIKTSLVKQHKRDSIGPISCIWYDTWEQDMIVYVSDETSLDFKHPYNKEELEDLIKSKKIVFLKFGLGDHLEDIDDKLPSKEANAYKDFLPLTDISLSNLGMYEELIIKNIRKRLQSKRLARDICRVINKIREKINIRRKKLFNDIEFHQKQLNDNKAEYSLVLSDLDSLQEDKKTALSLIRKNN